MPPGTPENGATQELLPPSDAAPLAFADFYLDPPRRRLLRGSVPVPVSPRAFDILCVLAQRFGQPVHKADLMRLVWPDVFVEESNLAHHVSQLRRLLGDTTREPRFIATVPTVGYQFIAEVRQVGQADGAVEPERPRRRWHWLVAGLLALAALGVATAARRPATSPRPSLSGSAEARRAYERAQFLLAQGSADASARAVAVLTEAVRLDPSFALAHADIASAHVSLFLLRQISRGEALDRAQTAAATALRLDPALSAAHAAQGAVHLQLLGDPVKAQSELRHAVALDPSNAMALDLLARALRHAGRYEESIVEARRALALTPTSVRAHMNLAQSILFSRHGLDEGLDVCRQALELDPNAATVLDQAADIAELAGLTDEAVAFRVRAERARNRPALADLLVNAHAASGYPAAVRAYLEAKLATLEPADLSTGFERGRLLVRLGRLDEAFDAFDAAAGAGFSVGLYALRNHPAYSALQADPRFEVLVVRAVAH